MISKKQKGKKWLSSKNKKRTNRPMMNISEKSWKKMTFGKRKSKRPSKGQSWSNLVKAWGKRKKEPKRSKAQLRPLTMKIQTKMAGQLDNSMNLGGILAIRLVLLLAKLSIRKRRSCNRLNWLFCRSRLINGLGPQRELLTLSKNKNSKNSTIISKVMLKFYSSLEVIPRMRA